MVSETRLTKDPSFRWIFVFFVFSAGVNKQRAADVVAMNSFVDRVAASIEERIEEHDLGQSLDPLIETGSGVDPELARRFFGQQLKTSLRQRGYLFPTTKTSTRLELVVSIHRERVWAIGALIDVKTDRHFQIALETRRYAALDAALGVRRNYVGRRTGC